MGSTHEVWLTTDTGTRLKLIDGFERLEYSMAFHQVGICQLVLPGSFDKTLLAVDRKLCVWRAPQGGSMRLQRVYLIRKLWDETETNGNRRLHCTALDGNDLLKRRIIAYYAASAQASKTSILADTMMKDIVDENLSTGATSTARRLNASYFSIQPDSSGGPSITKSFAWRNVLT